MKKNFSVAGDKTRLNVDQQRESLKRQSDAPEDVVWIRSSVRLRTSLGMLETRNTSTAVRNRSQEI